MAHGKLYKTMRSSVDRRAQFPIETAVKMLKEMPRRKFDESIEVAMNLGVDPRHADQVVRGTVVLPHGTGRSLKVLVLTKGEL